MVRFPHKITITTAGEGSQDENGDWRAGGACTKQYPCRAEPASGNGFIPATDGSRINYSWIVYLPLPVDTIAPGSKVRVNSGEKVLLNDTVKRFSKGQLNARIWL